MTIGIKGSRPATLDMLLAVVRMFDDLRDPAKRAEMLADIEAEYAKLAEARAQSDAHVAEAEANAKSVEDRAAVHRRNVEAEAEKMVVAAKGEADRIVTEARRIAEQKIEAANAVRADADAAMAAARAAQAAADLQMTQARDLADQAAMDKKVAEKALMDARKVEAENARKAEAAENLARALR